MSIYSDNITSIDQFGPQFQFIFPRITAELNWEKWYKNDFDSLLPPPSIDNGYQLFEKVNLIKVPMFKIASSFYTDAAISEYPVYTFSEDITQKLEKELSDFLTNKYEYILKVIERATRQWSIKGRCILLTHEDGSIRY